MVLPNFCRFILCSVFVLLRAPVAADSRQQCDGGGERESTTEHDETAVVNSSQPTPTTTSTNDAAQNQESGCETAHSPPPTLLHIDDDGYVEVEGDDSNCATKSFDQNRRGKDGDVDDADGSNRNDLLDSEFLFLDPHHVCCGLCGEIVEYELLFKDHVPKYHKDCSDPADVSLLQGRLNTEQELLLANKNEMATYRGTVQEIVRNAKIKTERAVRFKKPKSISCIRVNVDLMTLPELTDALRRKMYEKLQRNVPVTLEDKTHARCGLCSAIVSLNRKFEIAHLLRHFNAWHPVGHNCSGQWAHSKRSKATVDDSEDDLDEETNHHGNEEVTIAKQAQTRTKLSDQDFAVVKLTASTSASTTDGDDNDYDPTIDNVNVLTTRDRLEVVLQCIWCAETLIVSQLAAHFEKVHSHVITTPKCQLCVRELVLNAWLSDTYNNLDFELRIPNENQVYIGAWSHVYKSESAMLEAVKRKMATEYRLKMSRRMAQGVSNSTTGNDPDETGTTGESRLSASASKFTNSKMKLGKQRREKRQFILPALRQAAPMDSQFVRPVSECHWECKLCRQDIFGAVISASAIRHFRTKHASRLDDVQMELCRARVERVSDGCMEMVNADTVECLICNLSYTLHVKYNICRAVRHLKTKHPTLMPEHRLENEDMPRPAIPKRKPKITESQTQPPLSTFVSHGGRELRPRSSQQPTVDVTAPLVSDHDQMSAPTIVVEDIISDPHSTTTDDVTTTEEFYQLPDDGLLDIDFTGSETITDEFGQEYVVLSDEVAERLLAEQQASVLNTPTRH